MKHGEEGRWPSIQKKGFQEVQMTNSRREFIKPGIGAACASAARLQASPMNLPIGFQNFEIYANLAKDWRGTWNTMAAIGYKFCDLG